MTTTAPPLPEPANPDGFSLSGDPGDWSLYSPKQITERDNWFLERLRAAEADARRMDFLEGEYERERKAIREGTTNRLDQALFRLNMPITREAIDKAMGNA